LNCLLNFGNFDFIINKEIPMSHLHTYQDFLDRVYELGFLPLSHFLPGLPSVSGETPDSQWHTGDPETDPWQWKDRAAEEKRAAYGCILGGHKGFVSARLYPLFYAACCPRQAMPDRWAAGTVSQTTWLLWQLFQKRGALNTADVRRLMGVNAKGGGSRVDGSLKELQKEYAITVAGNRRKIGKDGQPYGWPANVFERVIDWAPPDWLKPAAALDPEEAREAILDAGEAIGQNIHRDALARKLGFHS
jgi:hypothetical protein